MKHWIPLAVVALAFSACSKEETTTTTPTTVEVANDLNPLDSVGVMHNQITDSIISTYTTGSIHDHIDNYFNSDSRFTDTTHSEDYWNHMYNSCHIESTNEFVYEQYIHKLGMDSNNEMLVLQVLELGENYDGSNLNTVVSSIKEHENNALANNNAQDIQNYLVTSSVMRHTLSYWDGYVGTNSHKFPWKKVGIGMCDAIGGAEGYTVGSGGGASPLTGVYMGIKNASTASCAGAKMLNVL